MKVSKIVLTALAVVSIAACNTDSSQTTSGADNLDNLPEENIVLNGQSQSVIELGSNSSIAEKTENSSITIDTESGEIIEGNTIDIQDSAFKPLPRIFNSNYTSQCPQLNTNVAYTWAPPNGIVQCFYIEIPDDARTEFFAIDQTAARQVSFDVFHDVDANWVYTNIGNSSDNDADDNVIVFTEAGHYILQLYGGVTDGQNIRFGALVETGLLDQFEGNDDVLHATDMSLGYGDYIGNLDHRTDIDHFRFQSQNGQDVRIELLDLFGNNQWRLEVLLANGWVELPEGNYYNLSGFTPGGFINFRVILDNANAFNPNQSYVLRGGSRIDSMDHDVSTTENLVRMPAGSTSPFFTTQFHNELNWSATIKDSTGAGIADVVVEFHWATTDLTNQLRVLSTDSNGQVAESINVPDCVGDDEVEHWGLIPSVDGEWRTEYDPGEWFMSVPQTEPVDDIGVGGDQFNVQLAHICDQTLITPPSAP